jgi:hypothetical protein
MKRVDNNKEHNQDKQQEQGKGPNSPSVKLPDEMRKVKDENVSLENNIDFEQQTESLNQETGKVKVDKVNPTVEDVENSYDYNVAPSIKAMKDNHKWGL